MAKDNISNNRRDGQNTGPRKTNISRGKPNGINGDNKNKTNSKRRKSKKSKDKSQNKKGKKILKYSLISILLLLLSASVVGLGYIFAIIKTVPEIDLEKIKHGNQPSSFYSKDEKYIDTLNVADNTKTTLQSNEIPQNLKNAIVSIEDERFYEHSGIDVKRLGGAVLYDVKYYLTGKGGLQGASTLTQQLIKNTMLTNEQKIERKVKEIYLAMQLENHMTKDEILTAYLNNFPVGGISYGAQAGAKYYFNKNAKDLNLIECAYLAGVTQATNTYNAYISENVQNPKRYIDRTKTVLMKMREHDYINEETYQKALKDLDNGKLKFERAHIDYRLKYEWALDPALDQVKKDLKSKYKYTDEEVNNIISTAGLKIFTTIDTQLQDNVQKILDNYSNFNMYGADTKNKDGVPNLQAAATVIDYRTGEVRAIVGGRGNQGAKSTNRAYNALRSVGSSIKPLTSYGPAIDQKVLTAASVIDDSQNENIKKIYGGELKNSPNSYKGLLSLRESLKYSSNIGSVLTANSVGAKTGINYGEKVGLKFNDKSKGLSAVGLGQFNNGSNDIDGGNTFVMASAYGIFGNGGVYIEPKLYSKVLDRDGNVILEAKKEKTNVLSPQAAYILYDMLKGPITYNASYAKFGSMPVAGKTGTTDSNKDYWFAGLTPHYSAAVWVGYDNQRQINGGGSGQTAASLWGKIMNIANAGLSTTDINMPSGIVKTSVCMDSGKLPTSLCKRDPRGNRIRTEMFISGTQPTGYCETHVEAEVNSKNNLLANENTPPNLRVMKVFIKKDYPNANTADSKYVLPTSYDNSKYEEPKEEDTNEKLEDENNEVTPPSSENVTEGDSGTSEGGTDNKPSGDTTPPTNNTPPVNNGTPPTNNTPPANNAAPPTNAQSNNSNRAKPNKFDIAA